MLLKKKCAHTFSDHDDQVWSVAFNDKGTQVVSSSDDKGMFVYSIP